MLVSNRRLSLLCWLPGVLALSCLAGCGGGRGGQVTGKVTWNNQPVAGAEIEFKPPADAGISPYYAVTLPTGAYRLDDTGRGGVAPGVYDVTISWWTLPGGKPLPEGEEGSALRDEGKAESHRRKSSQEVVAGANTIDFTLDAIANSPPGG